MENENRIHRGKNLKAGANRQANQASTGRVAPFKLLVIVTTAVVVAELFLHLSFLYMPGVQLVWLSLLTGLLTVVLVFPFLYFFLYQPLVRQTDARSQAEQALHERDVYYQAIVEDQTELICRTNSQGQVIFFNQACLRFLGIPAEEIAGQNFFDLFLQTDLEQVERESALSSALETTVLTYQNLLPDSSGQKHWLHWTLRRLSDTGKNGRCGYQAVGRDITAQRAALDALRAAREQLEARVQERTAELEHSNEALRSEVAIRKQAEERLQEREARLQLLLSQTPAILWATDLGLKLTSLQGIDLPMMSADPRMLIGQRVEAVIDINEKEILLQAHQLALKGQDRFFECSYQDKYFQCKVRPFLNQQGEIIGCVGTAVDETDHLKAEEQVRLLAAALSAAANGIIITNQQGVIQWANPAIEEMTGFQEEDVVGKTASIFKSSLHSMAFYRQLWGTIQSGKVWRGEIINQRKDGSLYTEEQTITPVINAYGTVAHYIAIKQDITRRKQAEAEMQRRNFELSALNTINSKVNSSLELPEIFTTLRRLLDRELSVPGGAIFYGEDNGENQEMQTAWGAPDEIIQAIRYTLFTLPDGRNGLNLSIEQLVSKSFLLTDLHAQLKRLKLDSGHEPFNWERCLVVPLRAQSKVQGALLLFSQSLMGFTANEVQLFETLASQVGVAIQNARLFEQIQAGKARLQALSRRLVEIQENERRHIARELHDEASQALTYLIFALDLIKRNANNPEAVITSVAEMDRIVQEVLDSLHRLAVDLRPASLDLLGLIPALRQYAGTVQQQQRLDVKFETFGFDERLPNEVEISLYRIVQEAVANAIRHAQATHLEIRLEKHKKLIRASVVDDGVGFNPSQVTHSNRLGIFGMRERADMLGGKLSVSSTVGLGTSVLVEVPCDN